MGVWSGRVLPFPAIYIWSFLILQSMFFRRLLRRLAAVLAFGASSIFWKATAMIIRAQMLMYGKVSQENYVELTAASAIPNKDRKSPQILRY